MQRSPFHCSPRRPPPGRWDPFMMRTKTQKPTRTPFGPPRSCSVQRARRGHGARWRDHVGSGDQAGAGARCLALEVNVMCRAWLRDSGGSCSIPDLKRSIPTSSFVIVRGGKNKNGNICWRIQVLLCELRTN